MARTKASPTKQAFDIVEPAADALVESLRSVGYSVETALADLVDNCITAGATRVWLDFHWEGADSYITLLDDGQGMDEEGLVAAMRPGSKSPLEARSPEDLGRFGLGLKTASFSQCRRLTVATRHAGKNRTFARCWDLDHVARSRQWQLLRGASASSEERLEDLDKLKHGTIVLWEQMDRLAGKLTSADDRKAEDRFLEMVDAVEEHLAMVFHRFLAGTAHADLEIKINGHKVKAWDPFLASNHATYQCPVQQFGGVRIQGFVLPHKDRLSAEEFTQAGGPRGWSSQQGFYIYRNNRMLVAGGWLDLGLTSEEQYKLARIRIDLSNSMDREWDIDVKKSRARPPGEFRDPLRKVAKMVRETARSVYVHRSNFGKGPKVTELVRPWTSVVLKDRTTYRIVRDNPLIHELTRKLDKPAAKLLESVLRLLEETVPIERIWLDATEKPEDLRQPFESSPPDEVRALLKRVYAALKAQGCSASAARDQISMMEPFNQFPELLVELEAE
jgi:hypothetical protein